MPCKWVHQLNCNPLPATFEAHETQRQTVNLTSQALIMTFKYLGHSVRKIATERPVHIQSVFKLRPSDGFTESARRSS